MVSGLQPFKDGDVSSCSRNKIWRCSNFDGPNNCLCLAKAEGGLLYHSSFTYSLLGMIPQLINHALRKELMYVYIYTHTYIYISYITISAWRGLERVTLERRSCAKGRPFCRMVERPRGRNDTASMEFSCETTR